MIEKDQELQMNLLDDSAQKRDSIANCRTKLLHMMMVLKSMITENIKERLSDKMEISEIIRQEYLQQTNENPKYIFHGSSQLIPTVIDSKRGHDEFDNRMNEQNGIYGISIFKGAIPDAIGKEKVSGSIEWIVNTLLDNFYKDNCNL